MKIASEETYHQSSAIVLFVDAGSIYEDDNTAGISHMMERMAFKTTKSTPQRDVVQKLEEMGGNVMSSSSREMMGFNCEVLREHVPLMLSLLSDTVVNPVFLEEELDEQKVVIENELEDIEHDPHQFMAEKFHEISF